MPPLYSDQNLRIAHALRYDWTGWPTAGTSLPSQTAAAARATAAAWEADGLRLLELRATAKMAQLLFSATPRVSPALACQRIKGRLQHALRKAGTPVDFSRKVSLRSLGENTPGIVEEYIRGQVGKEDLADPRYREFLRQFTRMDERVDLAMPSETGSGRYWYNLHVVLVVANRFRIGHPATLAAVRDEAFKLAEEDGHRMAALALLPDHLHMALRGNVERSPAEIALAFQKRRARAAGCRLWQDGFYVGTFSEYDLDVIRRLARRS